MQKIWTYAGFLSIDVALGALASGSLAVIVTQKKMPVSWWILLPVTVWVIYALDHQLDGLRTKGEGQLRRSFHFRNRMWILPLAIVTGVVSFLSALFLLPRLVISGGLVLSFFSLIHLLSATRFPALYKIKEFPVSVLYVFGIWFGPIFQSGNFSVEISIALILHWMGAMGNLFLFAHFEREFDRTEGSQSLAILLGERSTRFAIQFLATSGSLLTFAAFLLIPRLRPVWSVLGVIALTPFALLLFSRRSASYRWIGDGIFLLAGIPFFLDRFF